MTAAQHGVASKFTRGDVVQRRNLVTDALMLGVVLSVDGHLVTTRWRLNDTHTMIRVQHEMHAGDHVDARLLANDTIKRSIDQIVMAERGATDAINAIAEAVTP